jgi:hypothetical protein
LFLRWDHCCLLAASRIIRRVLMTFFAAFFNDMELIRRIDPESGSPLVDSIAFSSCSKIFVPFAAVLVLLPRLKLFTVLG